MAAGSGLNRPVDHAGNGAGSEDVNGAGSDGLIGAGSEDVNGARHDHQAGNGPAPSPRHNGHPRSGNAAGPGGEHQAHAENPDTPAPEDACLLTRLAELLEATDPVPSETVLAARSAYAWRDLVDAQLALRKVDEGRPVRGSGTTADSSPGPDPVSGRVSATASDPGSAAADHRGLDAYHGPGAHQLQTFEAPDLTIVLEISDDGGPGGHRLIGILVPPGPAGITLEAARTPGGQRYAAVDPVGRFTLSAIPTGQIRLHCVLPAGQSVMTQWLAC